MSVDLPGQPLSFAGLCAHNAEVAADRAAVVDDRGRALTYRELVAEAGAFARGLQALGVGPGETIGLLAPNGVDWVVSALGCHMAAGVVAAFNTWVKAHDLDFLLAHSEATTLVVAAEAGGRDLLVPLRELLPELDGRSAGAWASSRYPALRRVIVAGGTPPPGALGLEAVLEAGRNAGSSPLGAPATASDVAFVLYTSGSTADPKGVPLLHGDMVANGFEIGERMGMVAEDRVWLGSPLFWSFGSANAMVATFSHAATLVVIERFDAANGSAQIARERCTVAYLLPAMVQSLAAVPNVRERFASVRTGATIGRPDEVRAVAEGLGVAGICNVYGSTETYGNCCVTPHDMPIEQRVRCQGPPLPGMEVRVVDPATGEVVEPGREGEVLVRGRITPGYLKADELNEQTFDPDGWYHTGDIGRVDASGCFVFVTRESDMIKTNGINVSPAEVEAFLLADPAIAEAVVVGAPDAARGEAVVAFVRPAAASLDPKEVVARCRHELAAYKVPQTVHIVDHMPQTVTGKLSRKQLRDALASGVGPWGAAPTSAPAAARSWERGSGR